MANISKTYNLRLNKRYKHAFVGDVVSLFHVKDVALNRMFKIGNGCNLFDEIINTDIFDLFLSKLVVYFHWFYELKNFESSLNPYRLSKELQHEFINFNMRKAEKFLGYWYGMLLLNISKCRHGYRKCKKTSFEYVREEITMWEQIFGFLGVFIWIAFGHKDHGTITKELNRLFMNDRVPVGKVTKMFTGAEIKEDNRFNIEVLKGCKSNVIKSFLPDKLSAKVPSQLSRKAVSKMSDDDAMVCMLSDFMTYPDELNYGIIGQPLKYYDSTLLYPVSFKRPDLRLSDRRSQRTYLTPEESKNYHALSTSMISNLANAVDLLLRQSHSNHF